MIPATCQHIFNTYKIAYLRDFRGRAGHTYNIVRRRRPAWRWISVDSLAAVTYTPLASTGGKIAAAARLPPHRDLTAGPIGSGGDIDTRPGRPTLYLLT